MDIKNYLKLVVEKEASDLFITVNAPVKIKIEGRITSVGSNILTGEDTKKAAYSIMSDQKKVEFERRLECDFATESEDGNRFRVNVFHQRGQINLVLRSIPSVIPTVEELGIPLMLKDLILQKRGLILMVGATGSGKTTTLASMIDYRNEKSSDHILTIEDPIEFSYTNKKSIVSQREIGIDTLSYANALTSSLRESPDVVLIGEIRNRETMEATLELCNTGHLVVSTMHANNANQALERVLSLFSKDMYTQLYMEMAANIKAIISQRLVLAVNNKRYAAIEIMLNTPHIADLIAKGQFLDIKEAMEDSGQKGMQTFDSALYQLYKDGFIELKEALKHADSKSNLEAKINFG